MEKVFWKNPYQRSLLTTVKDVQGKEILFDKTIAYSFSGGQESDTATVNGIPILDSRIEGFNILYSFPQNHGLLVGNTVLMEIDWVRRNKLMRYHMLCELVLAITNRYFGHMYGHISASVEICPEQIDKIGIMKVMARMTESGAYVDFDHSDFKPHLPAIQAELDKIIDRDLPIEKGYLNEAQQERYWRIRGVAMIPCGGTHVRSTGEVGKAILKREKTGSKVTSTHKAERIKIKLISEDPTHPGEDEQ